MFLLFLKLPSSLGSTQAPYWKVQFPHIDAEPHLKACFPEGFTMVYVGYLQKLSCVGCMRVSPDVPFPEPCFVSAGDPLPTSDLEGMNL